MTMRSAECTGGVLLYLSRMKNSFKTIDSRFESNFRKISLGLFWTIFTLKLFETLCFINYIDPFAYHIAFPRQWYETSFLEALKSNDLYLISGLFDYLYIIPMLIFKGDRFPALLMSQSMHFIFSIGIGSLILNNWFKKYYWGPVAGLCLLTISKSSTFFLVAKNDGALSLAVLVSFLIIYDDSFLIRLKGIARAIVIGLSLGLIPAIKLNGLLYVASIGLYFVLKNRKNYALVVIAVLSSLVLFLPFLIKNWLLIRSPFFPALLSLFPGEVSSPMHSFYSRFIGSKFELVHLFKHLQYFFFGKVFFVTSILLLGFKFRRKEPLTLSSNYISFIISASGYVLYLFINGGLPTYRFIFPGYFLIVYFIFNELKGYSFELNKFKIVPILILVIILADSKVDKSFKRLMKRWDDRNMSFREVANRDFPYSQFWNYVTVEPNQKTYVISDFLTNTYFAPKEVRIKASVVHREGRIITVCDDVEKLKKYHYALLRFKSLNKCYQEIESNWENVYSKGEITLYRGRY